MMFRFFTDPSHLRQYITLFAVVEGWLLLDIGLFVMFLKEIIEYDGFVKNQDGKIF